MRLQAGDDESPGEGSRKAESTKGTGQRDKVKSKQPSRRLRERPTTRKLDSSWNLEVETVEGTKTRVTL
jgi:hypothetical protein